MKRIFVILFAILPMLLNAGVIMKRSGERLEDISIKSVTGTEIIYVDQSGVETTILKSDVSAILYDDGRYEEIQTQTATSMESVQKSKDTYEVSYNEDGQKIVIKHAGTGAKEYNVMAYGVHAGVGYFSNSKYEDVTVEYRVIYKSGSSDPKFKYLGTSPFAYVTEKMYENPITGKGNPYFVNLMEIKPLVIENAKDVKKVEFRLSKEGYKTVIVKPIQDVFIGGGPVMFVSLDRLKPLKDGETNDEIIADSYSSQDSQLASSGVLYQETESINQAELGEQQTETTTKQKVQAQKKQEEEDRLAQEAATKAAALEQARLEAEQTRLQKEQAALEKQKEAEAKRMAQEQKKRDEDERKAQEAAAKAAALEQARLEAEQARLQKEQAALEKQREEAEAKRLAQEQKKREAEEKKLAQEAAKAAAKEQTRLEKEQARLQKEQEEREYQERSKYFVTKVSNHEYLCMKQTMNKQQYQNFLRANCPKAYAKYKQGTREVQAGWSLFSIGLAMNAAWALTIAPDLFPFNMKTDDIQTMGFVLGSVGAGIAVLFGIPTLSAGYAHRDKSCKIYNDGCASPNATPVTLNFKISQNGLGLAINF